MLTMIVDVIGREPEGWVEKLLAAKVRNPRRQEPTLLWTGAPTWSFAVDFAPNECAAACHSNCDSSVSGAIMAGWLIGIAGCDIDCSINARVVPCEEDVS